MSKEKLFEVLWNHFPSESCCYIDEKLVDAILALFAGEPVYQIFEPYEGWRDTCLTGDEFEGVRDKKRILYTAPVADERDARISEQQVERERRVALSRTGVERLDHEPDRPTDPERGQLGEVDGDAERDGDRDDQREQ